MRIVDVCAFYAPQGGGVKTYVERKIAAATPGEQEVIILAPGEKDELLFESPGGSIRTIKGPTLPVDRRYRYFQDEPALHAALDDLKPDLVEVSSPWSSPAMVARWEADVPRALIMHADPLSAYAYRWFSPIASRDTIDSAFDWFWRHLRKLDESYELVISAGRSLSDRLIEGGMTNVHTMPMGVESGLFDPALRDLDLRTRLLERCGLGPEATLLIALGRHASEKRWPMVFDAVTAAGYQRPIGLILFGDGRERAKVVRAAMRNPTVHLAAPVTDRRDLATILASADALVHGCEAETFCLAAAEAKASGLPIIVPDEGGASDQFVPGQGALYKARSGAALAAAIADFLASDPAGARRRAAANAWRVPTMEAHFEALFALYAAQLRKNVSHVA
ncbi:glycosyltransferase [Sphingobium nicotianae]|uniref:Glycosyltransferase n=1 Tax=Sphingobium nicotianae TaxID=2782607 RepID=A0A9X1DDS7_9SPHN|nr:glycosyltransferase [Sphingobium nicotianae]